MSERDLKIRDLQENKDWMDDFIVSFDENYNLIATELKNRGFGITTSAVNYYKNENCPSFAYILNEVFNGQTETYKDTTDNRVITKISDDFYDITGCITDDVKDHRLYNKDAVGLDSETDYIMYLQRGMGNVDSTDKFLTNSLIKLGNLYIDERIENTKVR